jgi:hypothetical protein
MKPMSPLQLEQMMSKHNLDMPSTRPTTREIVKKAFDAITIPQRVQVRHPGIVGEEALGLR